MNLLKTIIDNDSNDNKISLFFLTLAFLIVLPMIVGTTMPGTDISNFYAPMARAIGHGDWEHAFWHPIPPLSSLFGGVFVYILNIEPFTAMKLVSALFYALTTLPVYYLNKRIFSKKVAIMSVFLYILCSRIMRYGGAGLIDSGKIFFLSALAYAFICFLDTKKIKYIIYALFSGVGMALIRGDGIAFTVLFIFAFALVESKIYKFKLKEITLPFYSILLLVFTFILLSPWIFYEYKMTGFPITDGKQLGLINKFMTLLGINYVPQVQTASEPNAVLELIKASKPLVFHDYRSLYERLFKEIWKGFYPPYLLFSIPVIYYKIKKREWKKSETILATIVVLHTLILVLALGGTWIQKRYVVPVVPLMTAWTAIGLIYLFSTLANKIKSKHKNMILGGVVMLFVSSLIWSGTKKLHPKKSKRKLAKSIIETSNWIKEKGKKLIPDNQSSNISTNINYSNGCLPMLLSTNPQIPLLSNSDSINPYTYKIYKLNISDWIKFCYAKQINFIILDSNIRNEHPNFTEYINKNKLFKTVFSTQAQSPRYKISVVAFIPNLKKE